MRLNARRHLGRAVVVCAAAAAGLTLVACGSSSSTTTPTTVRINDCPLTGLPAPGNVIPARPALAMKVDNYSLGPPPAEARPQSGLDYADVIFEEQVEGAITRYVAVFQCHEAPGLVGPIRSARAVDVQILSELGHPLLVHVGGIQPVLNLINSSDIQNIDLGDYPSVDNYPPGRYAPYDTYTKTSLIWGLVPHEHTPPAPLFTYSTVVPKGPAVSQIHLDWSYTSDIWWRWDQSTGTWLRYYDDGEGETTDIVPDVLADGVQNQAQNVVIQVVHITYGPWAENDLGGQGSLEAQAQIADNSGKAYIFRNGRVIEGTWTHGALGSPTQFLDAKGAVIPLQPGRTWVELFPDVDPVGIDYAPTGQSAQP